MTNSAETPHDDRPAATEPPEPDHDPAEGEPDTSRLGYRDTEEERAYDEAQQPSPAEDQP